MIARFSKTDLAVAFRDAGVILKWLSVAFLVPAAASILFGEPIENTWVFVATFLVCLLLGKWFTWTLTIPAETNFRHVLVSATILFILYPVISSIPFILLANSSVSNGLFESVSAFTTTGLTVFPDPEALPASLVLWRSVLAWIGGAVAVLLAILGIFALYSKAGQLLRSTGDHEQVARNLRHAAKPILKIYSFVTLVGVLLLLLAGMTLFDAVNYSMNAVSTTGFHSVSAGLLKYDHRGWIEAVLMLLAILGATSFFTHYAAFSKKYFNAYSKDSQFRLLVAISAAGAVLLFPGMSILWEGLRHGVEYALFFAVGASTTASFSLSNLLNLDQWDLSAKLVLAGLMLIGGSSASAAGGLKVERIRIFAQNLAEQFRVAVSRRKELYKKVLPQNRFDHADVDEINYFFLIFFVVLALGTLVLILMGNAPINSLLEAVSSQTNSAFSTGIVNPFMPLATKATLMILMVLGRLEIIPLFAGLGLLFSLKPKKGH